MPEPLSLAIDGRRVAATSITLERQVDALAGSLRAALHIREGAWVRPGAPLVLVASGTHLFEGNVDGVDGRWESQGGQLEVYGRDLPARLVDCSASGAPRAWGSTNLLAVAEDLARPFGVTVVDEAFALTLTLPSFTVEPGETAFQALDRAARRFGVLAHADAFGSIVLALPGRSPSKGRLQSGPEGTVDAFHWSNDHTQRFRRYRVRALPPNAFEGLRTDQVPLAPEGVATDLGARQDREREIVASEALAQDACERLAAWHAAVSRARSSTVEVTVPRWRVRDAGEFWRLNTLVRLSLPEVGFAEEMLIAALRFEQQAQGDRTSIRLVRRDALVLEPVFESEADEGGIPGLLE